MARSIYGTLRFENNTANRLLVLDANNDLVDSSVTDTEAGYLSGVTSAIQTQLDAKEGTLSSATTETIAAGDFLAFVDISDSNNTKKLTLANLEATLNHDNLAGYVANEHIDHTAVTISGAASDIIAGGGDISASRTISTDLSGATTATIAAGDFLVFADIDDSNGTKKTTLANLEAALDHDNLSGYVANEHIDHSAVDITTAADSGLSGGGDITASRTLTVDITGTTAVGTLASTDEVLVYDVSGTALRKATISEINSASQPSFKDTWATADTATKAITHSLGSTDVMVQVFDIASGETIIVDTVDRTDANTVTVTASEAPPAGSWRVLILAI